MAKITETQLINQLKELKTIKPNQEWASLLKAQILEGKTEIMAQQPAKFIGFSGGFSAIFQRRIAYAFATLVFMIVGVLGFAQYTTPGDLLFPVKKLAEQSEANLTGKTGLNQNMASLSNRINDLALVTEGGKKNNVTSTISEISASASDIAKDIKNNKVNDPAALKEIAASLKTLASVSKTDLSLDPGVKDLYETIAGAQISDLKKSTLTAEQEKILISAEDLYSQGKYSDALEQILQISN
jgi:hypothetical protein